MRMLHTLMFCLATALFAGCTDDGAVADPPQPLDGQRLIVAPANFTAEGSAMLSITNAPFGNVMPDKCARPTVECFDHPFNVAEPAGDGNITGNLTIAATVTWTDPRGEFGLQLLDSVGTVMLEVLTADPAATQTSNVLESGLQPGDYNLRVVAYRVYDDSFALVANFTVELPQPASADIEAEAPVEPQGPVAVLSPRLD